MARRGDIDSKTVASRISMDNYIHLLKLASTNKKTISSYLADLINEFLNVGFQEKIVEVEKIVVDTSQYDKLNKLEYDYDNLLLRTQSDKRQLNEYGEKIRVLEEELSKFRKI